MLRPISSALLCFGLAGTSSAFAALTNGSVLSIDNGSFFTLNKSDTSPPVSEFEGAFLAGANGLVLGTTQEASGSHTGAVDGTETPSIDQAWNYLSGTGMHETKSASNVVSASGNTASIDFSGWTIDWGGNEIQMGGAGSIASVVCAVNCSIGETYLLTYAANSCDFDPLTCRSPTTYYLELHGTITSVVPVPPAIWLFGSGLALLAGLRRTSSHDR